MIQRRFIIRDIVSKVVDKEMSLRWDKASDESSWMNVLKYLRICIMCLIVTVCECEVRYWCSASVGDIIRMPGCVTECKYIQLPLNKWVAECIQIITYFRKIFKKNLMTKQVLSYHKWGSCFLKGLVHHPNVFFFYMFSFIFSQMFLDMCTI